MKQFLKAKWAVFTVCLFMCLGAGSAAAQLSPTDVTTLGHRHGAGADVLAVAREMLAAGEADASIMAALAQANPSSAADLLADYAVLYPEKAAIAVQFVAVVLPDHAVDVVSAVVTLVPTLAPELEKAVVLVRPELGPAVSAALEPMVAPVLTQDEPEAFEPAQLPLPAPPQPVLPSALERPPVASDKVASP